MDHKKWHYHIIEVGPHQGDWRIYYYKNGQASVTLGFIHCAEQIVKKIILDHNSALESDRS